MEGGGGQITAYRVLAHKSLMKRDHLTDPGADGKTIL